MPHKSLSDPIRLRRQRKAWGLWKQLGRWTWVARCMGISAAVARADGYKYQQRILVRKLWREAGGRTIHGDDWSATFRNGADSDGRLHVA